MARPDVWSECFIEGAVHGWYPDCPCCSNMEILPRDLNKKFFNFCQRRNHTKLCMLHPQISLWLALPYFGGRLSSFNTVGASISGWTEMTICPGETASGEECMMGAGCHREQLRSNIPPMNITTDMIIRGTPAEVISSDKHVMPAIVQRNEKMLTAMKHRVYLWGIVECLIHHGVGYHLFILTLHSNKHSDEVQSRCLVKNLTDMSLCASL